MKVFYFGKGFEEYLFELSNRFSILISVFICYFYSIVWDIEMLRD